MHIHIYTHMCMRVCSTRECLNTTDNTGLRYSFSLPASRCVCINL